MFTGIVTDVGRVRAVRDTNRDRRFEIETVYDLAGVEIGASISHAGCCLTVVEKGDHWFAVEVSGEGTALLDLLVDAQVAKSKREAREFLQSGAVSVNGTRASVDDKLTTDRLLHGSIALIRRGKKTWHVARFR